MPTSSDRTSTVPTPTVAPGPGRRPPLAPPIAAIAALAMTAFALTSGEAGAEADGPDFFRVIGVAADDVLNIRSEPRASGEKLGEIPPGADCVRNLGCQGGLSFEEYTTLTEEEQAARLKANPRWCRIEYEGVVGWAAGRYLAEGSCAGQ
jgi:hypothetical protein